MIFQTNSLCRLLYGRGTGFLGGIKFGQHTEACTKVLMFGNALMSDHLFFHTKSLYEAKVGHILLFGQLEGHFSATVDGQKKHFFL